MATVKEYNDIKDLVVFGASFGNALGRSLADGKIGVGDLINFIDPATKLPAALTGINTVPTAFKNLTPEQRTELDALVVSEFDIPNDKAEIFVEDSFKLGTEIFTYVQKHFLTTVPA